MLPLRLDAADDLHKTAGSLGVGGAAAVLRPRYLERRPLHAPHVQRAESPDPYQLLGWRSRGPGAGQHPVHPVAIGHLALSPVPFLLVHRQRGVLTMTRATRHS